MPAEFLKDELRSIEGLNPQHFETMWMVLEALRASLHSEFCNVEGKPEPSDSLAEREGFENAFRESIGVAGLRD